MAAFLPLFLEEERQQREWDDETDRRLREGSYRRRRYRYDDRPVWQEPIHQARQAPTPVPSSGKDTATSQGSMIGTAVRKLYRAVFGG